MLLVAGAGGPVDQNAARTWAIVNYDDVLERVLPVEIALVDWKTTNWIAVLRETRPWECGEWSVTIVSPRDRDVYAIVKKTQPGANLLAQVTRLKSEDPARSVEDIATLIETQTMAADDKWTRRWLTEIVDITVSIVPDNVVVLHGYELTLRIETAAGNTISSQAHMTEAGTSDRMSSLVHWMSKGRARFLQDDCGALLAP